MKNEAAPIEACNMDRQRSPLERFRAKWTPVRVKKTRQNKRLEPGSDSIRTDKALDGRNPGTGYLMLRWKASIPLAVLLAFVAIAGSSVKSGAGESLSERDEYES